MSFSGNRFNRRILPPGTPGATTALVEIDGQPRVFPTEHFQILKRLMDHGGPANESDFRKDDLAFLTYVGVNLIREHGKVALESKASLIGYVSPG